MKKIWSKIQMFWLFHFANPVVWMGENVGFKYTFRKFWLDISTKSGNWKMRVMADEHPYAYLLAGVQQGNEKNVFGFAETLYLQVFTLTRDQGLVNDVQKAIKKYQDRLVKSNPASPDEEREALEEVKAVQEYVDATPKERRKMERDINRRFKKAVKAQNLQESE